MSDKVTNARWDIAQNQENKGLGLINMADNLQSRKFVMTKFLDAIRNSIQLTNNTKILEIGGGPTCIFLALREGDKYAVDPTYEHLFGLYPTLREIEEYKDVNFISSPIEKAELKGQFGLIFMINALDHFAALEPVLNKIDNLLAPSGKLVIAVDCYADIYVSKIMMFFDIDLPHPHHFIANDIKNLFSKYELIAQDDKIFEIFQDDYAYSAQTLGTKIYRPDWFIRKAVYHLNNFEKKTDILFIIKFYLCYNFAFLTAYIRRREMPVYPLKKPRLFIFQKM